MRRILCRALHGSVAPMLAAGIAVGAEGVESAGAQAAITPQLAFAGEIAAAFQDLGMEASRAECYGQILQATLEPTSHDNAIALLRASTTPGDVRQRVMAEGFDVIGGFRAAYQACPATTDD